MNRAVFICQSCGNETSKWAGKCPFCGDWNTLVESPALSGGGKQGKAARRGKKVVLQKLSEIKDLALQRLPTGSGELDRVLGGGLVPGGVFLLAGEPGIGKSTLVLQLVAKLAERQKRPVLYVSGEESLAQIKIRAQRLKLSEGRTFFLAETEVETICEQMAVLKPVFAVIDSVQTLTTGSLAGPAGSVGQVRETALNLIQVAKVGGTAIFLIGHVTKEGGIAGPKILEHMVDGVISLEGERFGNFRLLRAVKNRFGATSEVGIFEMTDEGMREVTNPSQVLTESRLKMVPGSVVVAVMEGTRPILVEVQALVAPTQAPMPRRVARGFDGYRLQMLTAVLGRRLGLPLASWDVIVNVTGGMKVADPGADLGVALAIYSSFRERPLPEGVAVFGEVGLLGEIRPVFQAEQRTKEARRLGFKEVLTPQMEASLGGMIARVFKENRKIRD